MNKKEIYKKLREKGYTFQKIADKFGISRQAVHHSLNKTTENYRKYKRLLYAKSPRYRNNIKIYRHKYYLKNKEYLREYFKQYRIRKQL